jgi:uncharacterized repeat protein (TIGR03803 family)
MMNERSRGFRAVGINGAVIATLFMFGAPDRARAQAPYTVLHAFNAIPEATNPSSPLIQATDGTFYGVTLTGGAFDRGTVFRTTASGVVTVLHSFDGTTEGRSPQAVLVQANDGNFYGVTSSGGPFDGGTIFRMTPAGGVAVVHAFGAPGDGYSPHAALVQASDGTLYGTTLEGGAFGFGTVFRVALDGTFTLLHWFSGGLTDGRFPSGALVEGADGYLYGTTEEGGLSYFHGQQLPNNGVGRGTVFRVSPVGDVTIVHSFRGGSQDASGPVGIVRAADGNFYGTSRSGGLICDYGDYDFCGPGTAFRMSPDGAVTLLHLWTAALEGSGPSQPVLASDGTFYISFSSGGAMGSGTIFRMDATGIGFVIHSFTGNDGSAPSAL